MLIVIKSHPSTPESRDAVRKAAELAADIVLIEDAVGLALKGSLEGFCGTAFALEDDVLALMPDGSGMEKGVKTVSKEELELMLSEEEHSGPY